MSLRMSLASALNKGTTYKDQSTTIWIAHDDQSQQSSLSSTYLPEQNILYDYFEKKKIMGLFNFMVQHLIINEPDDPIEYLKDLTDKLLMWRSGTSSIAPHLYEPRHVEAVYSALDPAGIGYITVEQYHHGFRTLMLNDYEIYPVLTDDNIYVEKDIFIKNMLSALDIYLMSLIVPPYHHLCELTILPDESYDILFKDVTTKVDKKMADTSGVMEDTSEESSTDSCGSMVSCVALNTPTHQEDDEQESDKSDISPFENASDFSGLDLMLTRRGTLISKLTLVAGKIGNKAKELVTEQSEVEETASASSLDEQNDYQE